jgi:hypothetical protein
MIESPQSFVVVEECRKATWQNGFRRELGEEAGWARFRSTTAGGTLYLAAAGQNGPWFLALDHAGVVAELPLPMAEIPGPGVARYAFATLGQLYKALPKVYALSVSLPSAPLNAFKAATKDLPCTTEAERLVVQRVGQDLFRKALMEYWGGQCPLTGIADPELLRASHIIPWAKCSSDAERLNVHNGLLLSALWDAAFDRGLVTFDDGGCPSFSPRLSEVAKAALSWTSPIPLTDVHRERLAWHREHVFNRVPD